MDLTISIKEETVIRARRSAQMLGKTVEELVSEYLDRLGASTDPSADAAEFKRLSLQANGKRRGWKFDREAVHSR